MWFYRHDPNPLFHILESRIRNSVSQVLDLVSGQLIEKDPRFAFAYVDEVNHFASDAKLFRGCVRLEMIEKEVNDNHTE